MYSFPLEKNTLDLILSALTSQFQDVHFLYRFSDQDIVSLRNLGSFHFLIKKTRGKVYKVYLRGVLYARKVIICHDKLKYTLMLARYKRTLILTSLIQDSADKHISSKPSLSASAIP